MIYEIHHEIEDVLDKIKWGWLAQMVEHTLIKFSSQRECVPTAQAPGFFQVQINFA